MPDTLGNLAAELRTAINKVFRAIAARTREEAETFAGKRARARRLPGADPETVRDLDDLFGRIALSGLKQLWYRHQSKELRAAIAAVSPERRARLFDHLAALKPFVPWGEPRTGDVGAGPSLDAPHFEWTCHGFMILLCDIGFNADAGRAARMFDWLAHRFPDEHLLKMPTGWDYALNGFGAAKAIASAMSKGMALDETVRRDALLVFDRMHNVDDATRDALLTKGATLTPGAEALLAISGHGAQATFFRRMRACGPIRSISRRYAHLVVDHWPLWLAFNHEARRLIADVRHAFSGEPGPPTWVDDPATFRAVFNVSDDEMSWPWWTCEGAYGAPDAAARARPGFAALRDDPGLKRVVAPTFQPLSDDQIEALRRFARGETDTSAFSFIDKAIPDVDAFTFEGADPEGLFLDHLASLDATRPSPRWLKATDAHIARIGADRVLAGFSRWLGHLGDHSLGAVDWDFVGRAGRAYDALSRLHRNFARSSQLHGETCALRRLALRCLAEAGVDVGSGPAPGYSDYVRSVVEQTLRHPLSEPCVAAARGVVCAMSRLGDPAVPALLDAAAREFYFKQFGDCRSKTAGNAVLWSLGQIGTLEAAYALARLRRAIRDKSVAKLVDAAMEAAGAKVGLGLDDMRDLATPDYGIGPDGARTESLGPWAVTLAVVSSRKAALTSLDASDRKGRRKRGIPKAALIDDEARALAEELFEAKDDIALLLPEVRSRLQSAWRTNRSWRLADWRERFLDNGLVATLARRLIWRFESTAGMVDGIPRADGTLLLADRETGALPAPEATVRLWHPLAERGGGVTAWRERLRIAGIRQPFAQGWRTSYVVTQAERATGAYSNRFAGHILHQPPLISILRKRGWIASSRVAGDARSDAKPNRLLLPAFGVAAEFWFSGVGAARQPPTDYGAPNFEYVTTDRLVFHAYDPAKGVVGDAPMPLAAVPEMAFSETLCDLETVVDATSIAADRFWSDRGAAAARPISELPGAARYRDAFARADRGEAQALRKAFLETVLPSLAIAERCHVEGDWLLVDGRRATYRIHLGSAASQLAANGRHLCIVPGSDDDDLAFVPSEGDATLSLILSKALLLAADDAIEDPSILSQLPP